MTTNEKEISRLTVNDREIMIIDYSDCKEDKMIEILLTARKIIREENKPQRVLAIFNDNSFLTQKVMQSFNSDRLDPFLLERQAVCGVNATKKWIIEGNNIFQNNYIKIFKNKEEALEFLASN
ncbi:MAG: hypothetical protein QM734_01700 [Cyclobacteriaceae bacterium]